MAGDKGILESVGREIKQNPPAILARTKRKFGPTRAAKQQTAILLNKARQAGASVPRPKAMV